MVTKIVYTALMVMFLVLLIACGQQESFYGMCATQDGYTYKIQQGATACPYALAADVPSSERLGY